MIGFLVKMGLFWGTLYYINFWPWALEHPFWLGFIGIVAFVYTFAWIGRLSR